MTTKDRILHLFRILVRRVDAVEESVPEDLSLRLTEILAIHQNAAQSTARRLDAIDSSMTDLVAVVKDLRDTVENTRADLAQFADVRGAEIGKSRRRLDAIEPRVDQIEIALAAIVGDGGKS